MLRDKFRPWGQLDWILSGMGLDKWSLFGVVGTEDRSLSCWHELCEKGGMPSAKMLLIHDEHPDDVGRSRFFADFELRLAERRKEFIDSGGAESQLEELYLSDMAGKILASASSFLSKSGPDVILDISSMPKRFFFPILRRLALAKSIENLVVTYSIPEDYCDAALAEETGPMAYLPTFLPPEPEPPNGMLIVGLGYEPLGLRSVIERKECVMLFPYPSLGSGIRRNWDTVRQLSPLSKMEPLRMHIYDVPSMFRKISSLTDNGKRYAILAPYGPKTMSLAMCLFGIAYSHPSAFYTQPKFYHPEYSMGVACEGSHRAIHAYVIKMAGVLLYDKA